MDFRLDISWTMVDPGQNMSIGVFERINIEGQCTAMAACVEWLFVGTSKNTLVLYENRPAFGYPRYHEYKVDQEINDIVVEDNRLKLNNELILFPIKEPISAYSSLVCSISDIGSKTITISLHNLSFTLTDSVSRSRLLACRVFSHQQQVLALAYTDSSQLLLWRLEEQPHFIKHVADGPKLNGTVNMVILMYANEEVRVLIAGQNGHIYECVLFDPGQLWTGMVPMVCDIGDKNVLYIEAEDDFDICA